MGDQDRQLLRSKQTVDRDRLAAMLTTLGERIASGRVRLDQPGGGVDLELPGSIRVDLEVKDSPKPGGVKRELEIEISWMLDEQGAVVEHPSGGDVTIS